MHSFETAYGLTCEEMLDALQRHFRARVALEGVVAETHLSKYLDSLKRRNVVDDFKEIDKDGQPDFCLWIHGRVEPLTVEVKNVRDAKSGYREGGKIVAHVVETQKTRASKSDPKSRKYGFDQWDILAVCLGKKTSQWRDFLFIRTRDLRADDGTSDKLAALQRVPLPSTIDKGAWSADLAEILQRF